jgi:hypothetical protein
MRILLGTIIGATSMYLWTRTWRRILWYLFSLGDT